MVGEVCFNNAQTLSCTCSHPPPEPPPKPDFCSKDDGGINESAIIFAGFIIAVSAVVIYSLCVAKQGVNEGKTYSEIPRYIADRTCSTVNSFFSGLASRFRGSSESRAVTERENPMEQMEPLHQATV
ncbi:hypothetical protein GV64_10285 [Endozoicomonas elysicola]|uniref:Uncharacterized protein n=1 Tax=Endozoicomonas elysicola TaxID=305900 RepID=A0A081KAA6_9GAMM|nr:hypothetical protein GV64_10285 [Endozoicomonas elysicola]